MGTVRNVNYEKLGEAERKMLDQEGSGLNSGSNSAVRPSTAAGSGSGGRPSSRTDSLRDPRQAYIGACRICVHNSRV